MSKLRKIDQLELWEMLKEHELWLADKLEEEDPATGHVTKCARAIFRNMDLSDLDFSYRVCNEIIQRDMTKALFMNCRLWNCDMRGLSFNQAEIVNCDFRRADLRDAEFLYTKLYGNSFDEADLFKAEFRTNRIHMCDFSKARSLAYAKGLRKAADKRCLFWCEYL